MTDNTPLVVPEGLVDLAVPTPAVITDARTALRCDPVSEQALARMRARGAYERQGTP